MEAMTQEFMLHRRPHAEIWSAREGSDDDTSKIQRRNTPPTDPKQCQQKNKRSTSEIWWISTNHGQSQIPQNWEKNPTIRPLPSSASETKIWQSSTSPHVHLVHIRNIRCWFSNKQLTASNTHLRTKQDMNQTQVFFPGSDYTSYQV